MAHQIDPSLEDNDPAFEQHRAQLVDQFVRAFTNLSRTRCRICRSS